MTGVVQRGGFYRRGGVRIEYIIAAVTCVALLVAMTAVLLSVSDRKAKRELVRHPNANASVNRESGTEETPKSSAPATRTAETPVVMIKTPQPNPTKAPETPAVAVKPQTPPEDSAETPVVVTVVPQPAPTKSPEAPAVAVKPPTPPEDSAETPVVVTVVPQPAPTKATETPAVAVKPPTPPADSGDVPVVVTVTPQAVPVPTPDAPVVKVDASPSTPIVAPASSGPEIASDPLDTLKVGSRPVGNNWVFGTNGGLVSVQQSPQETSHCLRLQDTNRAASVWAMRKFPAQSEHVTFECRFRVGAAADGYALAILGNEKPGVLLLTRNGELGCEMGSNEWHALQPYNPNVWYKIRIVADVKSKTFGVFIDDVQHGENLTFRNPIQSADAWQVETPVKQQGTVFLAAMKVTQ